MRIHGSIDGVAATDKAFVYESHDVPIIGATIGKRIGITSDGRFDWTWDGEPDHWIRIETAEGLVTPPFYSRDRADFVRQGDAIRRVQAPSAGRERVLVLFGDSDTANPGPKVRTTSLDVELASPSLTIHNRAQGNLPIGTATEPDGGGAKRSGLDVIRRACADIPGIDIAVIRNGLNDAHYYLTPPTPQGIAKFRGAYEAAISALQEKGASVMVCEICMEGGSRDRNADAVINAEIRKLAAEKGCVLISPNIDAESDPKQYISDADHVHLTNAGTRYVAQLIRDALPLAPPIGGPIPPPPIGALPKLFVAGQTIGDFSYYHALAVPASVRAVDFAWLASCGVHCIEVWLRWPRTPGADVLSERGDWIPGGADRMRALLDQAGSFGIYVNTRVTACGLWRENSHDSAAQKRCVASLARLQDHPALLAFDVGNESENREKGPANGGVGYCHTSSGEYSEISRYAAQVAPHLRITVSISGPASGPLIESPPEKASTPVGTWMREAKVKGARFSFASPHDPRSSQFGDRTESYVRDLRADLARDGLGSLPIGLVEPHRNDYGDPPSALPLEQFERAVKGAKRAGAFLWCHHNGPRGRERWWDPSRPVKDQLGAVDVQVVERMAEWLG